VRKAEAAERTSRLQGLELRIDQTMFHGRHDRGQREVEQGAEQRDISKRMPHLHGLHLGRELRIDQVLVHAVEARRQVPHKPAG
jgi:hypothetical protein